MLTSPADRWSLTSWFSGFGQPDYLTCKEQLVGDLEAMKERIARLGSDASGMADVINAIEELSDRLGHLYSYLGCLSANDADDEAVKADEAWVSTLGAEHAKVMASLRSKLAELSDEAFTTLLTEASLKQAEFAVRRLREEGQQQMSVELEALAADLGVDGLHAWSRLYDTLTGKMTFEMTFPDGHTEVVPMSRRRALMSETDRALRLAAFRDGQRPWNDHAVTLAAALNAIAGTRLSLYRRRGIPHVLDTPLFDGAMSRASLEAMLAAIHTHLELPRRALRKAAKLQGTPALHYCDLEAPQIIAHNERSLDWPEACRMVDRAFTAAYPELGAYFREMLDHRWIEAQPRAGKRPGAFCTSSPLKKEERVYMTFHQTLHDIVTLAHEVGHAWHTRLLRPARSLAAGYPMTLAETASNFGEMILLNGLVTDSSLSEGSKRALLDQEMLRAHAYLINIPMRYEFEKAFYAERVRGEVSVSRLCELMQDAQRTLYGDTLMEDGTDPMFWASKMHFFFSGISFYNFPYVFGYLLSQALFARFKAEGAAFLPRYEAFLSMTGSASCEDVVRQTLGEDLTQPAFWATGLQALEPSIVAYEAIPDPVV
jgi:oligoendopeptidase F